MPKITQTEHARYVAEKDVSALLSGALEALLRQQPPDPAEFLGGHFTREVGMSETMKAAAAGAAPAPYAQETEAQTLLRESLEATLAQQRRSAPPDETHDAAGASLPEALQGFTTLAEEPELIEAAAPLQELEVTVARDPTSEPALAALRSALAALAEVTRRKIAERTDRPEEELTALVKTCQAAIAAGNRDFQQVYDAVFHVITLGEKHLLPRYEEAIGELSAGIGAGAEAAQRAAAGADPATLLADAAMAKGRFDVLTRCLGRSVGAEVELAAIGQRDRSGRAQSGLKRCSRVVEKAQLRPGAGRGRCERVCDVVRAMLVVSDMGKVAELARGLAALQRAGAVEVVRIKDRFTQPSPGGWRDLMLNVIVCGDGGDAARHVCELQVVHLMMLTARKGLPGHAIYAKLRNAQELIESCGKERELRREMASRRGR